MLGAGRLARVGLVGFLVLTGCRSQPSSPGLQASSDDLTPQATGLPATASEPQPQVVFSDFSVLPGDKPGSWVVLGLARNDSRDALEGVVASVELLDPGGSPIAVTTLPVALSILPPGASSPFQARFENGGRPEGARAELQAFRFSSDRPARVSVDAVHSAQSADGTLVLGSLRNQGPVPAQVREVIVVWRDADHSLSGMAIASAPHALMPEDGSVPWLAEVPGAVPGSRFEVFTAATAFEGPTAPPLDPVLGPTWRVTEQGQGFISGAIRNPGREPAIPEVAIAVRVNGRLVSLAILQSTVPLPPGQTLSYGMDRLPGLVAALDPAEITLEAYLTGRGVDREAPAAVLLPASIQQFEVIGGRVFMQGILTNPGPAPLSSAMVFVSLRSTTGDPQTARWLGLTPPRPGESAEFFVDVPVAAGDDPAMSEYDLRAFGQPLPESSW